MTTYKYKSDYSSSNVASKYGSKGLMLYALAMRFDVDDVDSLAAESLTDNIDDKGIDILHILPEEKTAIIIQGYMAQDDSKPAAKSKKASDFNTAISWALSQDIDKVPKTIRVQVGDLRNEVTEGGVDQIEFWYVHNLDESPNVEAELNAVVATAKAFLKTYFPGKKVSVRTLEVGNNTIENWYRNKTQTIMVDQKIECEIGDVLKKYNLVAYSDNTGNSSGPHLHFNVCRTDDKGVRLNQNNGYMGFLNPNLVVDWLTCYVQLSIALLKD